MTKLELTPSRKAKLIVGKVLEYAEAGCMKAEDCGTVFEALSNCLDSVGSDPELALEGLIDQIRSIIDAKEWNA
jgi:hypothetical protein